MLGYVYVMSNEAMPGKYKIGCTSKHPSERANELNNTSVPKPFVVEYCINIDNYENIEKLVHKELSRYNFGKEFFECELNKCILTIKQIADRNSRYSEAYRDKQIKIEIDAYEEQNSQKFYYKKEDISGYIYVMSREDKPGVYKIDYTLENPYKNTDNLYIPGTPYEFVVEYCMYTKNYKKIKALTQINLAEYNYCRNFFSCDLIKCISELKNSATTSQQLYREKYKDKNLKEDVEKYIIQSLKTSQNYFKKY